MSRRFIRSLKNISSSQAEIKIKQVTSNDSFGPTATELNDIAILTNDTKSLKQVTQILSKRLNDTSKNWRHILKSLTVILYCMITGSLYFLSWARTNSYLITSLKDFQIRGCDELSQQIRTKAETIGVLLKNDKLLEEKRSSFHIFRAQMSHPAKNLRSSLDISRDSDDFKLDSLTATSVLMRSTNSLDLSRGSSNNWLTKSQSEILSNKILANITEE